MLDKISEKWYTLYKERKEKIMEKNIWFDMDGTFVDLYGVENWLEKLHNFDASPYREAKPLVSFPVFARTLNKLSKKGWKINIVTWCAKNSSEKYDKEVAREKLQYISKHLPSVKFNKIEVLKYGTPKSLVGNGILFDDEIKNRNEWKGIACSEKNLLKKLNCLLTR